MNIRIISRFALATLISVAASTSWAQQQKVVPIDAIAAVVNSDVITQQELATRVRMAQNRIKNQNGTLPPESDLQRHILERMIIERAQMQLAKEGGIRVDDTMLDRTIARLAEQNKLSVQQFRDQLERDGTPYVRFREEIREEIVFQRLREREIENKIQVTDSEIENYLSTELGLGKLPTGPQEWNLAQILIRIPDNSSPEQIVARRARAEEAMRQLKSGASFTKVAATFSDAGDALRGGELGWRKPERLPQIFGDAAANLKEGEVSVLLKSANGFHIVKVLGKRALGQTTETGIPSGVQQTRARHILIRTNQLVSAADAKRKLSELKERLTNKAAKFEDLAKSFSNDTSASKGGDLGWLYPGDTVPEFERTMNSLAIGQVSEPIETPYGFHLVEVIERKTADVSQERQRLLARQVLRERKLEEATEDWLRQLRDRAYVEYRLE